MHHARPTAAVAEMHVTARTAWRRTAGLGFARLQRVRIYVLLEQGALHTEDTEIKKRTKHTLEHRLHRAIILLY